jgi:hypothetical protein
MLESETYTKEESATGREMIEGGSPRLQASPYAAKTKEITESSTLKMQSLYAPRSIG